MFPFQDFLKAHVVLYWEKQGNLHILVFFSLQNFIFIAGVLLMPRGLENF